jgi:hypothetical protein
MNLVKNRLVSSELEQELQTVRLPFTSGLHQKSRPILTAGRGRSEGEMARGVARRANRVNGQIYFLWFSGQQIAQSSRVISGENENNVLNAQNWLQLGTCKIVRTFIELWNCQRGHRSNLDQIFE